MDTKKLEYFLRIAEEGSLNRAASVLFIAQPALSRQMRLLEEQLGANLFERSRKGMQLTEDGKRLRKMISGPLRQLNIALKHFQSSTVDFAGNLVVGMTPSIAYMLAFPIMRRIEASSPDLKLHIVEENEPQLIELLIAGEIDQAFLHDPKPNEQFICRDLLVEECVVVGLPDAEALTKKSISFRHMARLPLILPSHTHELRRRLEHQAVLTQTSLNIHYECDSFQLTKQLIADGKGFGILPYSAFSLEASDKRFASTEIHDPIVTRHLVAAALPYGGINRVLAKLDAVVKAEIAAQVARATTNCRMLFDTE